MKNKTRRLLEVFIVSTAELSALTGIPMINLQKWAERGQADYVKKGRTYLFDKRDFTAQIAQHQEAVVSKTQDNP